MRPFADLTDPIADRRPDLGIVGHDEETAALGLGESWNRSRISSFLFLTLMRATGSEVAVARRRGGPGLRRGERAIATADSDRTTDREGESGCAQARPTDRGSPPA